MIEARAARLTSVVKTSLMQIGRAPYLAGLETLGLRRRMPLETRRPWNSGEGGSSLARHALASSVRAVRTEGSSEASCKRVEAESFDGPGEAARLVWDLRISNKEDSERVTEGVDGGLEGGGNCGGGLEGMRETMREAWGAIGRVGLRSRARAA